MSVIFAVILITGFYVFLALGIINNLTRKGVKWIYFVVSALGLLGTIMMFIVFNWDLEKGKNIAVQNITEVKANNPQK